MFHSLLLKSHNRVQTSTNFGDFLSAIFRAQNGLITPLLIPPFTNFYHLLSTFILLLQTFTNFYHLLPIFIPFYQFLPTFILLLQTFTTFHQLLPNFTTSYQF